LVKAETYAKDFMPYGTPCREMFDPATQSLEIMQCEIETLRKKVAELMAARDATPDVAPAKNRTSKGSKSA
jgi:serine O-acetyltransferase